MGVGSTDANASAKDVPRSFSSICRMVSHGTGSVLSKHFWNSNTYSAGNLDAQVHTHHTETNESLRVNKESVLLQDHTELRPSYTSQTHAIPPAGYQIPNKVCVGAQGRRRGNELAELDVCAAQPLKELPQNYLHTTSTPPRS